jgi:glycerol-3-phosphate acyltransferase PlsY
MEIVQTALLALAAFCLGACPVAVLVGRLFLGRDIRSYGDGNPGAANVFRAGGHKAGWPAVLLEIAKGVPFVLLAHAYFGLTDAALVIIAICPILGHAFSPFLHWHGGKAIAVTFGVFMALPQHEILFAFAAFMILGAFIINVDAWAVVFASVGTLAYLTITAQEPWEQLLMLVVLFVLTVKHFEGLRTVPGLRGRLFRWLQAVIRGAG